jgi:hypothetical protein
MSRGCNGKMAAARQDHPRKDCACCAKLRAWHSGRRLLGQSLFARQQISPRRCAPEVRTAADLSFYSGLSRWALATVYVFATLPTRTNVRSL